MGKTSTVCNIATELHKSYKINVIDFDSQKQFEKFNNKRENRLNIKNIKDSKEFISYIKKDKNLTIIDLGGYDSDLSRYVLLFADLVIVPLSDSDNDLDGLIEFKKIMQEIQEIQETKIKVNVLVNRVHHADKSTHKELKAFIEEIEDFNIFNTIIRNRKEYKRILSSGKSVAEQTRGSGAIEIKKLIKEIEEIINHG